MIVKFEQTGSLGLKSGRGHKHITEWVAEDIATAVEEDRMAHHIPSTSVWQESSTRVQQQFTTFFAIFCITKCTKFCLFSSCCLQIQMHAGCLHYSSLHTVRLTMNGHGTSCGQTTHISICMAQLTHIIVHLSCRKSHYNPLKRQFGVVFPRHSFLGHFSLKSWAPYVPLTASNMYHC